MTEQIEAEATAPPKRRSWLWRFMARQVRNYRSMTWADRLFAVLSTIALVLILWVIVIPRLTAGDDGPASAPAASSDTQPQSNREYMIARGPNEATKLDHPTPPPPCPGNCADDLALTKKQVEWTVDAVQQYYAVEYRGLPKLAGLTYVDHDYRATPECPVGRDLVAFCAADAHIYVGIDELMAAMRDAGKPGLWLGMGHELTHFAQDMAGFPTISPDPLRSHKEYSANCGAGAFFAFMTRSGVFTNADRAQAMHFFTGDPLHGSHNEQITQFDRGFNYGLAACNSYVPEFPIIVHL